MMTATATAAIGPNARLRQPLPARQPIFHRIFRAEPMTVRAALMFLRERFQGSAQDEVIGKLELALAEVLNNICEHGIHADAPGIDGATHPPVIHLCVARHVGGIACAITDDGRPLPESCLNPRPLPLGQMDLDQVDALMLLPEGGFGWYLIQGLTVSLSYFREGRRNFLAFIVPVTEPLHAAPSRPDPEPDAEAAIS
ncbi:MULTISPECIES: ATP-binding protein [unclassified Paracoccus (in: a-proteobacteria)]|uniref:ATP-binding protein n=1 Tax=unclassified Paracoccus (in: a-proteobacteria) TaxID=2688777 RepID=UPI001E40C3A9|nr:MULTISPECIES: ATP-binding protein [unclassified Paracoccus (in: a-proteobacteria)]UXU76124.1 ATP-binding protein [Paracoccus sp. SMMA_5]UXU82036.1 ATP-binding protein [Paracoccus sp. SMMA_5_TC]